MQRRRTRQFHITLLSVFGFSFLFLGALLLFGAKMMTLSYESVMGAVFFLMSAATASFLAFSFVPYFQNDRRWYGISALLTLVFFASVIVVWQIPTVGGM